MIMIIITPFVPFERHPPGRYMNELVIYLRGIISFMLNNTQRIGIEFVSLPRFLRNITAGTDFVETRHCYLCFGKDLDIAPIQRGQL